MIKEAKDVLEAVIKQRIPTVSIARSIAEENRYIMARQWPLVSLITNPGRFEGGEARLYRYIDEETKTWKQRYARGVRILPILVRVWAEGENQTDELFSRIIPVLPRRWMCDGFQGYIDIQTEEHSDFVDNVNKLYLSVAEVQFSVPVAGDEERVPTFNRVEAEPEIAPA